MPGSVASGTSCISQHIAKVAVVVLPGEDAGVQ